MKNLPRFVSIVLAIILTCGCSILEPVPDQSDVTQNEGTTTSTVKPVDEPSAVSEALAPIGKISAMIIIKAIITAKTLDDFLVPLFCLVLFTINPPTV